MNPVTPVAPPRLLLQVLVVDDTPTNRQILSVFMRKLGHGVDLAEDGAQAVEKFAAKTYDLVIMDVMMPVMDGYEATRLIKAMCGERWVPVVFLSALEKDENLVAGLDAGGDDYLSKPVNFVVLEAKLRSLSRTIALNREVEEARRFNQAVTDNLLEAIVTIDERGLIETVNPAATHIFGYRTDEMVGRNINMLMPEPYHTAHDGYLARYVAGGAPHVIGSPSREVEGRRSDGGVFPMSLSVSEFRDLGRRMFVGAVNDISMRKEAERRLRENAAALQLYHDEREAENTLALEIFDQLMQRPGLSDPALHFWMNPASHFSGDIVAATRAVNGKYYVLLADATGHGLAAAISVLPLLTQFYDSAGAGVPLSRIIYRINTQLRASLPIGRFIAAAFICLDKTGSATEFWLGGMPAGLLIDAAGKIVRSVPSHNLPLGIDDIAADGAVTETLGSDCPEGGQLVLFSDGFLEASNAAGEEFGLARLTAALAGAPPAQRLAAAKDALYAHLGEATPHDDVTLIFIDLPSRAGA
jgi:PAS domain S-box-containing protein